MEARCYIKITMMIQEGFEEDQPPTKNEVRLDLMQFWLEYLKQFYSHSRDERFQNSVYYIEEDKVIIKMLEHEKRLSRTLDNTRYNFRWEGNNQFHWHDIQEASNYRFNINSAVIESECEKQAILKKLPELEGLL